MIGHSKSLNTLSTYVQHSLVSFDNKPASSTGQQRDQTLRQVRIPQMETSEVTHVPLQHLVRAAYYLPIKP